MASTAANLLSRARRKCSGEIKIYFPEYPAAECERIYMARSRSAAKMSSYSWCCSRRDMTLRRVCRGVKRCAERVSPREHTHAHAETNQLIFLFSAGSCSLERDAVSEIEWKGSMAGERERERATPPRTIDDGV